MLLAATNGLCLESRQYWCREDSLVIHIKQNRTYKDKGKQTKDTYAFRSKYIRGKKLVKFLYEMTDNIIEPFDSTSCSDGVSAISM